MVYKNNYYFIYFFIYFIIILNWLILFVSLKKKKINKLKSPIIRSWKIKSNISLSSRIGRVKICKYL